MREGEGETWRWEGVVEELQWKVGVGGRSVRWREREEGLRGVRLTPANRLVGVSSNADGGARAGEVDSWVGMAMSTCEWITIE